MAILEMILTFAGSIVGALALGAFIYFVIWLITTIFGGE